MSIDPELIEYKRYYSEKNNDKKEKTVDSVKYSKPAPKPALEPEPEPFEFHPEKVSNIFEKGLLWFGDPCYVVPDKRWDSFCGRYICYVRDHQVKVTDEGETFYSWSTAYGDGEYDLKKDGKIVASLGVDAGMLSVIPMRLIKKWINESGENLGDILPGYFSGGYILPDSFQGKMIVEKGNMSFDGSDFSITILTDW